MYIHFRICFGYVSEQQPPKISGLMYLLGSFNVDEKFWKKEKKITGEQPGP